MFRTVPFILTLSAAPALALSLPDTFTGGWGLTPAACAAGPGAEGYLEVTATELRFYESTGTLVAYETVDAPGLMVDLSFSGEGETWTETVYLETRDDGATLVRIAIGPPRGIPVAYVACDRS